MDSLLVKLKSSSLGYRMGECYARPIEYADDLILLSPTRSAKQKMLDFCVSHNIYCGFNFNVKNLFAACLVDADACT